MSTMAATSRAERTAVPAWDRIEGRRRTVIESVSPQIDGGIFPIKRVTGDLVCVEADIFSDGHDLASAVLLYRHEDDDEWHEVWMEPWENDRWRGSFVVETLGRYYYTLEAWIDHFLTWRRDLAKRVAVGKQEAIDGLAGARLIREAADASEGDDQRLLTDWVRLLSGNEDVSAYPWEQICGDVQLAELMRRYAPRRFVTRYTPTLTVVVDRPRARFSTWYEMFPRSAAREPGRHATLRDVEARLPYVAQMGFDVLYLPPIHPIGHTHRKGRNNRPVAEPDEVGSPWGIGSEEGGHKAIHPQLGTLEDFRRLVERAADYGLEIALDIAFQCSPDHPYAKEHPEWFRRRPDGSIQYAENPPKKYEDIYAFDFECADWRGLWEELKSVFLFWIDNGVRIFRVDNPHTKPFAFWQWLIDQIKRVYPDVLFLSEAFTRPKIMYRLAKLGFSQSYTYFAWRNTKHELTRYMHELTQTNVREFFRPNFWPNTPDILTEYLQVGGRPAFMTRLVLAATLASSYGIYGPPFEHCWSKPREPGSEEYLNSEKYEVHFHDLDRPDSLAGFIARVNRIRREHTVLQTQEGLRFHQVDNDQLIAYSRSSADRSQILLVVVNLDPNYTQSGWVELPLDELQLDNRQPYQLHDLLSDARYLWHGPRNFVQLNPHVCPAHLFRLRRRMRTERDFEYYL